MELVLTISSGAAAFWVGSKSLTSLGMCSGDLRATEIHDWIELIPLACQKKRTAPVRCGIN